MWALEEVKAILASYQCIEMASVVLKIFLLTCRKFESILQIFYRIVGPIGVFDLLLQGKNERYWDLARFLGQHQKMYHRHLHHH